MKNLLLLLFAFSFILSVNAQTIFINEIHYDNAGPDVNEGVEIAGSAGTDLNCLKVYVYGGAGSPIDSITLSGTIDDDECGYGAVFFPISGLATGTNGFALVDTCGCTGPCDSTDVLQFISYEGVVAGVAGPVTGNSSSDIGVFESNPAGTHSLQLTGTGTAYSDFSWMGPDTNTRDLINVGQSFCSSQATQPDLPNPTANMQRLDSGSLVIPMDTFNQAIVPNFNLHAYGLVHELLMNDIPIKWVIRSGKGSRNDTDFTASSERIWPSFVSAATIEYRSSAFVIDTTYINKPPHRFAKSATQVISDFGKNVAVYELKENVMADIRYTLEDRPKIAVFDDGGNADIHTDILDSASITNYAVTTAGVFPGLSQCYTFASDPHYAGGLADSTLVKVYTNFIEAGGNFFGQCETVETTENFSTTTTMSTNGITVLNWSVSHSYHNQDLAFMQFTGNMAENWGGSLRNWTKNGGSWHSGFYHAVSDISVDTIVASGAHLIDPDSVGGNLFFSGGHSYAPYSTLEEMNAARLYLNATLIPANYPADFAVTAGSDTGLCTAQSLTLGGSPTAPGGSTYSWTPGTILDDSTIANPSGTIASSTTFWVQATYNGCTADPVKIIVDVSPGLVFNMSQTPESCNGGNDAFAMVNVTVGMSPYSYLWSDAQTSVAATNLFAGAHSVIVTDAGGCTGADTITISEPALITGTAATSICDGDSILLGGIFRTLGGVFDDTLTAFNTCDSVLSTSLTIDANYFFPSTTPICAGDSTLIFGTYQSVAGTYSDSLLTTSGCDSVFETILVVNPVYSVTDPAYSLCLGDSVQIYGTYQFTAGTYVDSFGTVNGCDSLFSTTVSIIVATSGTASATICTGDSIFLGGAFQTAAGPYVDVLTNSVGCDSVLTTTLTVNAIITNGVSAAICAGDSIFLSGAYQTGAGFYNDTLTAGNTCDSVVTTTLTVNSIITNSLSASICSNDSIFLAGAYQTTAGAYDDTFTAGGGCDSVVTTTLNVSPAPSADTGPAYSICGGDSIQIGGMPAAFGGTPPYTYSWFPGAGLSDSTVSNPMASPFSPTNYSLLVTDSFGCMDGGNQGTPMPVYPIPMGTLSSVADGGSCTGTASISVSIGTPPFTYAWNDVSAQTTSTATGLCAGFYDVLVTDSNGCIFGDTITVGGSVFTCSIAVTVSSVDASCGNSDGSATATVTGGALPLTYNWTSGDTLSNTDSLSAGMYMVDVWDSNGCNTIGVATISDAGGPGITTDLVTNVQCNGDANGAISLSVSGGTPPYNYTWSSGDTIEDLANLQAGPYDLQVIDDAGCMTTVNLVVGTPSTLNISTISTDASCGGSDGSVVASPFGGTAPYTYSWSTSATSSSISGLIWGAYGITVTDANGCIDSALAGLSETGASAVTIDSIVPAPCSGDGGIYITPQGGATPFTYMWSNGPASEDNPNAPAGMYDVVVTDSSGCMTVLSMEVPAEVLSVQPICLVTVDTVDMVNVVVWEKPSSTSIDYYNIYKESTSAGIYFLAGTVDYDSLSAFTDPNSNPLQRSWRYRLTAVDFCGNESDFSPIHKTMHVSISKGLGNDYNLAWNHYDGFTYGTYYVHRWRPIEGWVMRDSLPANLSSWTDFGVPQGIVFYVVEAKPQGGGCIATKQKNFNSSKSNTSTAIASGNFGSNTTSQDASLGICDGSAIAIPSGGVPPYTFLWDDSLAQATAQATGLCPGNYIVTIVDGNGNSVIDTAIIGELAGAAPIVDYIANFTVVTVGDSIDFADLSTNAPTSWFWLFSGGAPSFSSDQNPVNIQYNTVGTFDVSMIATNAFGSDTVVKAGYIVVDPDVSIGEFSVGPRNVKLSPNPFTESTVLTFDNAGNEKLRLVIYDISGKRVRVYSDISAKSLLIQRGDLGSGTYYFHLEGVSGRDAGAFIVE